MESEEERFRAFKRYFTRKAEFVGLLSSILFCTIYLTISHVSPKDYVKDVQSMQCQRPNYSEGIGLSEYKLYAAYHEKIRNPYKYQLMEYLLYKRSGVYRGFYPRGHLIQASPEKYYENLEKFLNSSIIVMFFPGTGDSADSLQFLAKTLRDRPKPPAKKEILVSKPRSIIPKAEDFMSILKAPVKKVEPVKDLRFHFLSMEFSQVPGLASYEGVRRQQYYAMDFIEYISNTYNESSVFICHGHGSIFCYWVSNFYSHSVSLMILESSPSDFPGFYATNLEKWMQENMGTFIEGVVTTGIISIDSGYDDTNTDPSWLTRRHGIIPVWAIDGVPDNGLSPKGMHKCKPYSDFISDLLAENKINQEKEKPENGSVILNAFVKKWYREKRRRLPRDWKKDEQDGLINVQIGGVKNFVLNGSRWLEVDVQRNSSVILQISGPCLTAATIVRRRRYIKRKEKLFNSILFEFGIYQLKPFEQVRVFLESKTECPVTIETSPWWLEFTQRFHYAMVLDPHFFWVGAQIAFIFLATLESDKRAYRWEHQMYLYALFILSGLYHTFTKFGMLTPGLICGAGLSITVHFLCSTFHEYVILRHARRSLDSMFRKFQRVLKPLGVMIVVCYWSSALSAISAIMMFTWSIRPMLLPAAAVAHIPMLYRIFYQPMIWGQQDVNILMVLADFIDQRRCFVGYALIGALIYLFIGHKISRLYFHMIAFSLFVLQLTISEFTLDFHYGIGISLLALNHSRAQNLPRQVYGLVDLELLERAYLRQDDEDEEQ